MKIYLHKVRSNAMDGWGRSLGMTTDILGIFTTKEKAETSKKTRDEKPQNIYFDVGESWIEEKEID